MNRCAYQQKALGEMRMGDSISGVVCPKPRRLGLFNPPSIDDHHIRPPSRWYNYQTEVCGSKAGTNLLDMFLTKGSYGVEKANTPPFFAGSPPSRASNPVIQDARFGNDKPIEASPSPSPRKQGGGCVTPAAVRIEGFSCRGSCSISAVA